MSTPRRWCTYLLMTVFVCERGKCWYWLHAPLNNKNGRVGASCSGRRPIPSTGPFDGTRCSSDGTSSCGPSNLVRHASTLCRCGTGTGTARHHGEDTTQTSSQEQTYVARIRSFPRHRARQPVLGPCTILEVVVVTSTPTICPFPVLVLAHMRSNSRTWRHILVVDAHADKNHHFRRRANQLDPAPEVSSRCRGRRLDPADVSSCCRDDAPRALRGDS